MRINSEIAQLEERLAAAEDVLRRTVIPAPVDGTIVGLRLRTTGGVVKPGEVLLQIVPSHDALVIDTRVQPVDIAAVHVGQTAQVHLLPFAQRNLPIIEGRVAHVGADSMTDERTGERFYDAKVVVERELIKKVAPEIEMSAGMPADILIVTGERSAFRYIVEPIERSFRMSLQAADPAALPAVRVLMANSSLSPSPGVATPWAPSRGSRGSAGGWFGGCRALYDQRDCKPVGYDGEGRVGFEQLHNEL